ncbi:MAG: 1,4-alpha-glucan branching protein GlgB [Lachnospiraceae bacterium]|nr:1,4-alpha-glucan branching protein GlgB [Lachnospiraceae bacterium]
MDKYGFYSGRIFDAYEYLGCHLEENGAVFRVFAPSALKISVIGEFNDWQDTPMEKIYDGNFWECRIKGVKEGMMYKYRIYRPDHRCLDHCDPYGFGMELRPHSASIVRDMKKYHFSDKGWMNKRTDCKSSPLNIYELHAGSWRMPKQEEGAETDGANLWMNYRETADALIPYLKEYGYNYVEIMPLAEHPCDESWGYQSTGFFSPTSRYGTADDLKEMINRFHQNEIGVILDFVPVHFAVDDYALAEFDGTALYEYPHVDVGYSEWGSRNFMHSRGEVRSFLQSSANYWLKEYHVDGLRMDAISNMIYWQGNKERGVNANATEFLSFMNQGLKKLHKGILLAAEDSTSFPGVTKPAEEGGLGFDYKWDMGWMNDTLDYFDGSPAEREVDYHKLTFSMMYYPEENYLLPLSHDEVVHGKNTIIQKMNGEYEDKFPQARAMYTYMYAHPGKKLNFMGNELAHFREWDEKRELDWDLLKYPLHDSFHRFAGELNHLYLNHPAFWKLDYNKEGFQWVNCHEEEKCIYSFLRNDGKEQLLCIFNFSNQDYEAYELEFPAELAKKIISAELLLDSNEEKYGGTVRSEGRRLLRMEEDKLVLPMERFSGKIYWLKPTKKA